MDIHFNISTQKVSRVVDAVKFFYPVPLDAEGDQLFTDNQWAKEAIRRHLISLDQRYRTHLEQEKINVARDDSLLS